MSTSLLITLTHTVILSLYLFTTYCTFWVLEIPNFDKKEIYFNVGQLKFLTIWNVISQTFFSLVCLLNDLFGTNSRKPERRPFIRKFKDYYHTTIGFPVAMFVGLTFWALMFIDRELVLPKILDPYFPGWINHLMHTMIVVTTILEMLITPREYSSKAKGLKGLMGFMLTYLVWLHFVYYMNGVWAYPVIEVLTWPLRIVFYLFLFAFVSVLYYTGEVLDRLIWGKTTVTENRNVKKIK